MAAKLHVDSLSTKTSIKKLKNALENLSTNLNVLYDEAILRIEEQNSDYRILAKKALRWVAYTYRPLTVEALQEALAIELEDLDFDIEAIQPIGLILDVCAGLLAFDEENEMVRLVHYTAQDYFDKLASSKFDDAHVLIAKECLVYLSYGIFQNSQASTDKKVRRTSDAASDSQDEQDMFYLFGYATTFWAQHAMTKRDLTLGIQEVHRFLARHPRVVLQSSDIYDKYPYQLYPLLEKRWNPLRCRHGCEIAAFYGLNDELEIFCGEIEGSQAPTDYLNSSLHVAVSSGQYRATKIVLDHRVVIDNTDKRGRTALHQAASLGHLDLVKLLVARGADIDARHRHGTTPLLFAGRNSREDCIIALINSGADIHVKDYDKRTILHWACKNGLLNIVNILLARNMSVDERDADGETPLFFAVRKSHTDFVLALLDHGANPKIQDPFGFTVLHKAASHGNLNAVNILLARGAEIEVRDRRGRTPLLMAAERGHNDCVLALLDHGVDINSKDVFGSTALHKATSNDHPNVVDIFLARGAEIEVRDRRGRTPLLMAAKRGHNDCILPLIGSGADVNVQDDDGFTPLHLASATDSIEIMVELSKHDAAVDTRSGMMCSVKTTSEWVSRLTSELKFSLDEGCQISVCSAIRVNSSRFLKQLLLYWDKVLEMLFWKDGLTALDIAMLREDEEMIRMLEPLTPSTGQPLTVSVEIFLLELVGVTSIEEAREELNRRTDAEEEAEDEDETEDEAESEAEEEDREEAKLNSS